MENPGSEFEFPIVNRSAMTIKMKKAFVDWANQLPDRATEEVHRPLTLEEANSEPVVYLIPEIYDPEELDAYLERSWIMLFEHLLSGWISDAVLWPKKRTFKMFTEWFEIACNSMVYDLWGKEPLEYSDY